MSAINDGGPAFPQHDLSGYGMGPSMRGPQWTDFDNPPKDLRYTVEGMSLRDWFAGQALMGDVAATELGGEAVTNQSEEYAALVAKRAYRYADAMLAERAKGGA